MNNKAFTAQHAEIAESFHFFSAPFASFAVIRMSNN